MEYRFTWATTTAGSTTYLSWREDRHPFDLLSSNTDCGRKLTYPHLRIRIQNYFAWRNYLTNQISHGILFTFVYYDVSKISIIYAMIELYSVPFDTPVSRRAVLCDWVWRAGGRAGGHTGHTGFRTITFVLYIGSLPNLATRFPCGRVRTLFILGSLGQRSRSPLL